MSTASTPLPAGDCVDFWRHALSRIAIFETLDDAGLVFGARTRGFGHQYRILPRVSAAELLAFERSNHLELPVEYRTFLQTFGAGGAGPHYGVEDFRKYVQPNSFAKPFPYSATFEYSAAVADDDPIWNLHGLAFICQQGCGTDHFIELNGSNPGRIWCSSTEACSLDDFFLPFYRSWLDRVDVVLHRYRRLKELRARCAALGKSQTLPLSAAIAHMGCDFTEWSADASNSLPAGEIWVHFADAPGTVILDERRQILRIDMCPGTAV